MKLSKIREIIKEEYTILLTEQNYIYVDLAKKFAGILEPKVKRYYMDSVDDHNKKNPEKKIPYSIHQQSWSVKVKPGKKWIKIDVGQSGKYMLSTDTGNLHYIKGYGKPDLRKNFGNIQKIIKNKDNWWYDGYSISPKGSSGAYGYAGKIE